MEPGKHRAERTCLGCRQAFRQDQLVRFVLSPDGEVLADYRRKLPGRGGYVCLSRECIDRAIEKKQFERAFRVSSLHVDQARIIDSLKEQIIGRVLSLLGMARKSSNSIAGSNLVLTALSGKEALFMIFLATDISKGIGEKILQKASFREVPCYRCFDKAVMGKLMGRSERSVIALRSQQIADSIKAELLRLDSIAGES